MARLGPYAPQFQIRIDGEELPAGLLASIASVKLQNGLEGADRVEMALANQGYRWLDHPLLHIDRPFSLAIGYAPDPLTVVFAGEITGVEPTFPSSGIPTINIAAQDRMHRLTRNKKDLSFIRSIPFVGNFPLPDAAVIASALGDLKPSIDPVGGALSLLTMLASYLAAPGIAQKGVRSQESTSSFDFLTKIAKDSGWEMYIDHSMEPHGFVMRFKSIVADMMPEVVLRAGETLIDFTPRLTSVGDVEAVTARIWVDSLKTEFVLALSWDFDRKTFDFRILPGQVGSIKEILGPAAENSIDVKPPSFATAPQTIFNELLPRLNNRLTGSGSTVGHPQIMAGKVIGIEGLGERFSGLYRVTSATHSLDSGGYKTTFEVRQDAFLGAIPVPKGVSAALGGLTRNAA